MSTRRRPLAKYVGPVALTPRIKGELVTQTTTRPASVIRRSPKWWDGPSGAGGIRDKVF